MVTTRAEDFGRPGAFDGFDGFDALTFDCYGTPIDWETGSLTGWRAVLDAHGVSADDDDALLETYARFEAEAEAGPYQRYRDVLGVGPGGNPRGPTRWGRPSRWLSG